MADWDDVRRVATALPEVRESTSYGSLAWRVRDKSFLWERPLRRRDIEEFEAAGLPVPTGAVLGARMPDLGVKEALIAADPDVYFTTSHFDGYPAVLSRLDRLSLPDLEELTTEAWLARAPKTLARAFLDSRSPDAATRQEGSR